MSFNGETVILELYYKDIDVHSSAFFKQKIPISALQIIIFVKENHGNAMWYPDGEFCQSSTLTQLFTDISYTGISDTQLVKEILKIVLSLELKNRIT